MVLEGALRRSLAEALFRGKSLPRMRRYCARDEMDSIRCFEQLNFELPCLTMPRRITQGFLQNSKEGKRDVQR
jgi:hypothetical protein